MILMVMIITTSLVMTDSNLSGFHVGRLSEGQFEYPALNGYQTPGQAREKCDADLRCGGFTYKGSKLLDKEYPIYFFKLVLNIEEDVDSWKWIFYRSNKTFIQFPGAFEDTSEDFNRKFVNGHKKAELKCNMNPGCVGMVRWDKNLTVMLVDYLDLTTLREEEDKVTFVKVTNLTIDTNIDEDNSWDLDRCCPSPNRQIKKKETRQVKDTMPRISCDIPQSEFLKRYVLPRDSVILVNCTHEWVASTRWSIENLLKEGEGEITWQAEYEMKQGLDTDEGSDPISGKKLQEIIRKNGTIKIFDQLNKREYMKLRQQGNRSIQDKLQLTSEYSSPSPVDSDYYLKAGLETDYQWIIYSHKNTGTNLHYDPDCTAAWNTVLSGHKWWALLPPEIKPDDLLCDPDCSGDDADGISSLPWFRHVLPQLRGRKFYGSTLREFMLGPGETIYMPVNSAHAILNIDDNMSVTENYFLLDSLEDWIHGVMMGDTLLSDHEDYKKDEDIFWRAMYYKLLNGKDREAVRAMRDQVEKMTRLNPQGCKEYEEKMARRDFPEDYDVTEELTDDLEYDYVD